MAFKYQCQYILDSGADINIMSLKTYKKLNLTSLNKCNVKVSGFGGKNIPIVGQCQVECKYNNNMKENISFIVTNIDCPTVLGLPNCQKS